VQLARDPAPLFFLHRHQPGRQRAQFLAVLMQLAFRLLPLGDLTNQIRIQTGQFPCPFGDVLLQLLVEFLKRRFRPRALRDFFLRAKQGGILGRIRLDQFARAGFDLRLKIFGMVGQGLPLILHLAPELIDLNGAVQGRKKIFAIDGLGNEVVRASAQRLHGQIMFAVPGDQQRGSVGPKGPNFAQEGQPVHTGHFDVRNDRVVIRLGNSLEGLSGRIGSFH